MNNVLVRELNFPIEIEGVIVVDNNGDYNIYINSNLSDEKKKETLDHELRHLQCDHHYIDVPIVQAENEANQPTPISNEVLKRII